MSSIKRNSIKDQIYDIIRNKIMTQEYKLGDKINMLSLSKELNVSNTPIREALSMLERDGLIEIKPNAGPSVINFSKEMFSSIAESVEALLLGSYDLCVKKDKITPLIAELERSLEHQKSIAKNCDENQFAQATIEFDGAFMRFCDNNHISAMYESLADLFYLSVLYDHWYIDTVRDSIIQEHSRILDAVKAGDVDAARTAIKVHYSKMP